MTALPALPGTVFAGPDARTAGGPPESRGLARDEVRLLVAGPSGVTHTRFRRMGDHLQAGDLLVVNTSATLAAQVDGRGSALGPVVVHVAASLDSGDVVVELRSAPDAARPVLDAVPGEVVTVAGTVRLRLLEPYPRARSSPTGSGNRLWRASLRGTDAIATVMAARGRPIAYGYLDRRYPLPAYQTVFAREPGSAEMPSAARPFSARLVTELVARGVRFAPVLLHTGVSSQEAGEAPQPERYAVSKSAADLVNATRRAGGRVVAVGTTATRAVESATGDDGVVRASRGWTDLLISSERPVRVVGGLVTGWHDPQASHLLLVESVAGPALTQAAYDAALAHGYLWHEFGDSALLLPG
ncbi:MAG TPA: S-adenosylmethionine:tRNA ribosyltransferase-isomerase [Dermatophilaceae bacterium]|nr:S-adenosylmethionine:tRNA ribosyltransferase-isomerase [Dermatophilaceae bacterium]